jgi:transcription-repair coupling factor (superfamily II helicase)
MHDKELENIMADFYHRRYNLLVCTTIIESGIDVPTANTIIINRADRFGLAQLHQLRGRVGRSHHQAYAYLLTPPPKSITSDARRRLDAIATMGELGSGFILATHDLEIRGAGELLGEDQSGQITAIGFDLYMQYLDSAIKSLQSGEEPDLAAYDTNKITEIDLQIPVIIPDMYVCDVNTRLTLYKRIANAKNLEELDNLQIEMIDRFGLLPQEAKNLFSSTEIKLLAEKLGIRKITANIRQGSMEFLQKPNVDARKIITLKQKHPKQ